MKRFIYKFIGIVGVVAVLLVVLNCAYVHSSVYYNLREQRETAKYMSIPEKFDILNLGASHGACGFDYSEYPQYDTFNMGLGGQSVIYDWIQLDYFRSGLHEGSIVILPVSYGILRSDIYRVSDEKIQQSNKRYYDFLDVDCIIGGDEQYAQINRYMPLLSMSCSDLIQAVENWMKTNDTVARNRYSNIEEMLPEELNKRAQARYESMVEGMGELPETVVEAYENIFNLCEDIGAIPVLVTTPIYCNHYECWPEEFLDDFYRDIEYIVGDRDIVYLDYSCDERLFDNKTYFYDVDHFNQLGALAFTEIVLSDIDRLIGLPEPSYG